MSTSALLRARRIVVRQTNWVGDVIMTTPALARLRRLNPEARITVLARKPLTTLLENNPDVDDLWTLDDRTRSGWWEAVRRLRRARFDAGLVLANSTRSALLLRMGGVSPLRGYAREGRRWLLGEPVPAPDSLLSTHDVLYYLRLLNALDSSGGDPAPGDPPLRYFVREEERLEAPRLLAEAGFAPDQPLVVVAPGAAYGGAKRWAAGRFAEAAAQVAARRGWGVAATGGPREIEACEEVCRRAREAAAGGRIHAANTAKIWSLRQTAAILAAHTRLLLTNDSGLMHLGAAVGAPLVAIFGPTDWVATAPWTRRARVVRAAAECAPCMLRECPTDHRCMTRVQVEDVVRAAESLLEEFPRGAS